MGTGDSDEGDLDKAPEPAPEPAPESQHAVIAMIAARAGDVVRSAMIDDISEDKANELQGKPAAERGAPLMDAAAESRQRLAFASGALGRLGARSALWPVPLDVLRLVGEACVDAARAQRIERLRHRPAEMNEGALMDAAQSGRTAEVRVLLAAGADPDAVDEKISANWTAMIYAAMAGHEETVAALAEGGADPNKADSHGSTPLMWAACMGRDSTVRQLLELGADCMVVSTGAGPFKEGKTALELAEERGQEEAGGVLRVWGASQRLAFASGSHARLGANSPLRPLPDVLRLVGECAQADDESDDDPDMPELVAASGGSHFFEVDAPMRVDLPHAIARQMAALRAVGR